MFLPMMWKILTVDSREYLQNKKNASREQKKQMTYNIKIGVSSERPKQRRKIQPCDELTTKKAYHMVRQTWIIECLKMYKKNYKVMNFITNAMEN